MNTKLVAAGVGTIVGVLASRHHAKNVDPRLREARKEDRKNLYHELNVIRKGLKFCVKRAWNGEYDDQMIFRQIAADMEFVRIMSEVK